jgi:hypothetical protein
MNDMGSLMDQVQADLLKQWQSVTPEQRAEEERRRQIQRDWEAAHTAIETEQEIDDEQEGD